MNIFLQCKIYLYNELIKFKQNTLNGDYFATYEQICS